MKLKVTVCNDIKITVFMDGPKFWVAFSRRYNISSHGRTRALAIKSFKKMFWITVDDVLKKI